MSPTEKHRETAKDIAFDFDCDWTADGRRRGEAEYRAAIDAIARALANAEREGMRRAAEMARGHVYRERYRAWPWWNGGNRSNESEIVQHSDAIASAILSEAREDAS